jgi:hypothetical protein
MIISKTTIVFDTFLTDDSEPCGARLPVIRDLRNTDPGRLHRLCMGGRAVSMKNM